MASGTIRGSFSGVHWAYPEIVWSSSSNVASNSSSVTAILYFVRTANYNSYNLDGHTVTMNVNGSASASRPFNLNTSRVEVWRRTVSVNHHPDGAQSITIGASSSGTGNSLGSYNFSGTAVLDKIPRAYSFKVSETTHEMDTPLTVLVNNNGSGFSAKLRINFGGKEVYYTVGNIGSNFNITPKASDFAPQIPNTSSGWGGIHLDTYSGSTKIGTYSVSPFTMTVPASIVPTLDSLTSSDVNDAVTNAIGSMSNTYIQGLSSIRFSANNAKGVHGSTIQKFTFSIGDWSVNHAGYLRDMNLKDKSTLTGTQTAKVVITDSRGRTASKTLSINILPYTAPSLNISAERTSADQTKVLITPTGKVSSVKNGTTEKNTYTIKMEYKLSTATTWTEVPNGTITSFEAVTLASVAKDKSYSLQVTLSDKFYTVVATQNISTTKVLLDLCKDTGIGVGKLYEEGHGVLDVGGAIYTNKTTHNFNGSTINNAGIYSGALPAGDASTRAYWQSSAFPNGISSWWSDNNANVTNKPSDYAHVTLFKFETEIKVIWSEMPKGEVSSFYANSGGQTGWNMGYGLTGQKLWTGTVHVIRGETLTISKPLSKCKNGWILKWMWYRNNKPSTEQIHFHVIHKSQLEHIGAGVSLPFMHWSDDNKYTAFFKYVYVGDNTISGNAINNGDYTTSLVLSGVYEF